MIKRTKQGFIVYSGGFTGFIHKNQLRKNLSKVKKNYSFSPTKRSSLVFSLLGRSNFFLSNFDFCKVEEANMGANFNFVNTKINSKFRRRSFQSKRFRFSFGSIKKNFFKDKTLRSKRDSRKKM